MNEVQKSIVVENNATLACFNDSDLRYLQSYIYFDFPRITYSLPTFENLSVAITQNISSGPNRAQQIHFFFFFRTRHEKRLRNKLLSFVPPGLQSKYT